MSQDGGPHAPLRTGLEGEPVLFEMEKDPDHEDDIGDLAKHVKKINLSGENMIPVQIDPVSGKDLLDIRAKVWSIFEEPDQSLLGAYVNIWVLFLIMTSAVVTCVETIPGMHKQDKIVWLSFEIFYVTNFTAELVLRSCCCPNFREFASSGMNWIDFISVAPFYIELALADTGVDLRMLRILRLGRALRLVKLVRYSEGMQMIGRCMAQSADALQLFACIMVVLVAVCASLIYYVERGTYEADGKYWRLDPLSQEWSISPYQSIPDSVWWVIVTLTTVGYGDVFPITYFGQFCGFVTQMLGVLCLALPLSIVGANFFDVREAVKEWEKKKNEKGGTSDGQTRCLIDAVDDVGGVVEEAEQLDDLIILTAQVLELVLYMGTRASIKPDVKLMQWPGLEAQRAKDEDAATAAALPVSVQCQQVTHPPQKPAPKPKPKSPQKGLGTVKSMAEFHKITQTMFDRYDLDGSGNINSIEEKKQLITNLLYHVGALPEVSRKAMDKLAAEDDTLWNIDELRQWVIEAGLGPCDEPEDDCLALSEVPEPDADSMLGMIPGMHLNHQGIGNSPEDDFLVQLCQAENLQPRLPDGSVFRMDMKEFELMEEWIRDASKQISKLKLHIGK